MQDQPSQAIVRRFYDEVFTQKRMALVDELFASNVVFHDLASPAGDLPATLAAFPDIVATVNLWVVDGDLVTAYVTFNGTHQAEFLGVPATGKAITFSLIDIWRVNESKLVELWHHVPNNEILEQIRP